MTFLYPQFLFGLVALAIPIVIHLFDFRKTKKVYFSDTRFLDQVKQSTSSLYRLKHLLILFSRMLFITFLVMAFAQPFIPSQMGAGLTANRVGIFIDNSLSMSNEMDVEFSGLDLAKETAIEIIDLYPSDTEFNIISADVVSGPGQLKSRQEAYKYLAEIGYASQYKPLEEVVEVLTANQDTPDIYILSDFQKSTMASRQPLSDSISKYFVIPINFPSIKNIFVDSVYIENPFLLDSDKVVMKAIIENIGLTTVENLPVKILINGRQVSATTITMAANERTQVSFDLGFNLEQFNKGTVNLEDYPVSFDNSFFFTLNMGRKVNVMEIAGSKATVFIQGVYGNTNLFNYDRQIQGNMDFSSLNTSDLVVLNQLEELSPQLLNRINDFYKSGGSVLLIPGELTLANSFTSLVANLRGTASTGKIRLASPDFERPFFENILLEDNEQILMPEAEASWQWGQDRSALLKFQDGRPFLSEYTQNLFVMAAPLNEGKSSFATHALFVPVMYRIAAKSGLKDQPLFYRIADSEMSFRIDSVNYNERLSVEGQGIEIIPDQRMSGKEVNISLLEGLLPAGHYDLVSEETRKYAFSLNNETQESDLVQMTTLEINEIFSQTTSEMFDGDTAALVAQQISTKYKGFSLWRYALSLCLLFLLLEVLFIRLL